MSNRVQDLINWALEEGIELPLPAETIARLEEGGAVVDLLTGAIIPGGADVRYSATVLGQANAVVWNAERARDD